MPWWIWLVLVLFMIAVLVAGAVFAGSRAMSMVHTVSEVGDSVSQRISAMKEKEEPTPIQPPVFTQPLRTSVSKYTDAHVQVVQRKTNKRLRHASTWVSWKHFNN